MRGQVDHWLLAFHCVFLMGFFLLLLHLGCLFLLFQVDCSGESEVAQFNLGEVFGDEYIFGFEVSVEDL